MNNTDAEYFRLLELVLSKGKVHENRTGINTVGVFGAQAKFDLSEGFPLLTTKKVWFKGIVHELLWMLKGDTNIKYLVDNDVHIWDEWAYSKYRKNFRGLDLVNGTDYNSGSFGNHEFDKYIPKPFNGDFSEPGITGWNGFGPFAQKEFIDKIKNDSEFASKWGDLGEGTYGGMWRAFPFLTQDFVGSADQIQNVVDKLLSNPDDRRLIVSAWHPYWVDHCALPPCHCLFQFHTEELTDGERIEIYREKLLKRFEKDPKTLENFDDKFITESLLEEEKIPKRRLNLQLYQRSCDLALGVPFNIASYSLLLTMVAQVSNMVPGVFTHTYGDLHLYENSIDAVKLQLSREPIKSPTIKLNPKITNLFDFKYEDIELVDYKSHPAIKIEVAV